MKGKKPLRPNVNNDADETSTNSNGKEIEKNTKRNKRYFKSIREKIENTESKESKDEIKRNVVKKEINEESSFNKQNIDNANERKILLKNLRIAIKKLRK